MKRKILVLAAVALVAAANSQARQPGTPVAESLIQSDAVSFFVENMSARHELRVSCGKSEPFVANFEAGEDPFFIPVQKDGSSLADGECIYQLRALASEEDEKAGAATPQTQYGTFEISGGSVMEAVSDLRADSGEVR
jgi:hypothetical protein